MNILPNVKGIFSKRAITGLLVGVMLGVAALGAVPIKASAAVTLGGPQDCDMNAVIYCGAQSTGQLINSYNAGNSHNSATSIHDIYNAFGISAGAVNAMNTTAVAGSVTKTGNVYVAGSANPVATNAVTAGRENIAGSTRVVSGSTTFYKRAPSVSFRSSSITAYVVMSNGVFQYAILSSCANPVSATPIVPPTPPKPPTPPTPPKPQPEYPDYTLNKQVAVKGSSVFTKGISVKSGTHVTYRITVKSTGQAIVTGLVVNDTLPANVTYDAGTLTRDGNPISGTSFFKSGVAIGNLGVGATTTFQFDALIGTNDTTTTCTTETLNNVGHIAAISLPPKDSNATVTKGCNEVPPVVTPPVTPPVVTPPAPVLPNTGAGSTVAIFGTVTALAAGAYNFMLRRRAGLNG